MGKSRRDERLGKRLLQHRQMQAVSDEERRKAAVQADVNRQLRRWSRRRVAAWSLFVLAIIIGLQHVLAHGGVRPLPMSMTWQDLLLGYPAAGFLGIIGLFVLEPRRH